MGFEPLLGEELVMTSTMLHCKLIGAVAAHTEGTLKKWGILSQRGKISTTGKNTSCSHRNNCLAKAYQVFFFFFFSYFRLRGHRTTVLAGHALQRNSAVSHSYTVLRTVCGAALHLLAASVSFGFHPSPAHHQWMHQQPALSSALSASARAARSARSSCLNPETECQMFSLKTKALFSSI